MGIRRKVFLPIAITLSVGATGLVGYTGWLARGETQEREQKIVQMVDRFKACPDRFKINRECFSPQERQELQVESGRMKKAGRWEEAGMAFAKLGRFNDAREMAEECNKLGNETGTEKIREEIALRREAIHRMRKLLRSNE